MLGAADNFSLSPTRISNKLEKGIQRRIEHGPRLRRPLFPAPHSERVGLDSTCPFVTLPGSYETGTLAFHDIWVFAL